MVRPHTFNIISEDLAMRAYRNVIYYCFEREIVIGLIAGHLLSNL